MNRLVSNPAKMFKYKITYDEKIVSQMMTKALRLSGYKSWPRNIVNGFFIFIILSIFGEYTYDLIVLNGDLSQVSTLDHLVNISILVVVVVELVRNLTLKKRRLKKIKIKPDKYIELTIDANSISIDDLTFQMEDMVKAEVYFYKNYIDLYMIFPSIKDKKKTTCFWTRLTPQNLVCGNHRELVFFLKMRLRERVRVFVTAS